MRVKIVGLFFILVGCAAMTSVRAKSDHFDGKKFYNQSPVENKNFWTFIKWQFISEPKPWPESVRDNIDYKPTEILTDSNIAVTFVNHATVLIQVKGVNILTDPVWSERASPFTWLGPKRVREPGIDFENLPPIHLVLVTHNHYDHLDLPTLKKLNDRDHPQFLVALGDRKLLEGHGIQNVQEMDWAGSYFTQDLKVTFLPTQHWSGRGFLDRYESLWGAYLIEHKNKKIYFGGDSGYASHYKKLKEEKGSVELAFLPIGAYEPRWFMKDMHLNPAEAVQAHEDLGAKTSIGIHFGTWQMSDEGIDQPEQDLTIALKEKNPINPFLTLKHGQTYIFMLNK